MIAGKSGRRVLVTGAAGFIGMFLCPRLVREGYEVTALDMDESRAASLKAMGMRVVTADLTKPDTLRGVCRDIDIVIHLAARVKSWGTRKAFYDSILQTTKNLLAEAAGGNRRFVYFSSICAAGAGGLRRHLAGHREDDPEARTGASYYCDAKYDAEQLVLSHHRKGLVEATIVRPANVIGPGSVWVTDMIDAMNNGPVFPLVEGGRNNGCFVYVENLVDGVILALGNEASKGRTYHLRDDYDATWKDYITDLGTGLDRKVKCVSIPFAVAWGMGYLSDKLLRPLNVKVAVTRHTVGLTGRDNRVDTSRARDELGWKTRVPYPDAMEEICRWARTAYPVSKA
ncbi:MAG TPA: NAD(P)-dependent oxidoreductase [Deltaproteobacteria bacterium]|nr:NAD(P)-dependent oxidoreductase [Deltaproteobacteria bacterium]